MRKNAGQGHARNTARNVRIRHFALHSLELCRNQLTALTEPAFSGSELQKLGFIMDCGSSLAQKYPGASLDMPLAQWEKLLERIDLQTLGNAIFSRWRYFNHWAESAMSKDDQQWFVLSLTKLAQLAEC